MKISGKKTLGLAVMAFAAVASVGSAASSSSFPMVTRSEAESAQTTVWGSSRFPPGDIPNLSSERVEIYIETGLIQRIEERIYAGDKRNPVRISSKIVTKEKDSTLSGLDEVERKRLWNIFNAIAKKIPPEVRQLESTFVIETQCEKDRDDNKWKWRLTCKSSSVRYSLYPERQPRYNSDEQDSDEQRRQERSGPSMWMMPMGGGGFMMVPMP